MFNIKNIKKNSAVLVGTLLLGIFSGSNLSSAGLFSCVSNCCKWFCSCFRRSSYGVRKDSGDYLTPNESYSSSKPVIIRNYKDNSAKAEEEPVALGEAVFEFDEVDDKPESYEDLKANDDEEKEEKLLTLEDLFAGYLKCDKEVFLTLVQKFYQEDKLVLAKGSADRNFDEMYENLFSDDEDLRNEAMMVLVINGTKSEISDIIRSVRIKHKRSRCMSMAIDNNYGLLNDGNDKSDKVVRTYSDNNSNAQVAHLKKD